MPATNPRFITPAQGFMANRSPQRIIQPGGSVAHASQNLPPSLGADPAVTQQDTGRSSALQRRSLLANPETGDIDKSNPGLRAEAAAIKGGKAPTVTESVNGGIWKQLADAQRGVDQGNLSQERSFQSQLPDAEKTADTTASQRAGTFANTPEFQRGLQADIADRTQGDINSSNNRISALNSRINGATSGGTDVLGRPTAPTGTDNELSYVKGDNYLTPATPNLSPALSGSSSMAPSSTPPSTSPLASGNAQPAIPMQMLGGVTPGMDQNATTATPNLQAKQRQQALQRMGA